LPDAWRLALPVSPAKAKLAAASIVFNSALAKAIMTTLVFSRIQKPARLLSCRLFVFFAFAPAFAPAFALAFAHNPTVNA
jgi:hypothetical protein